MAKKDGKGITVEKDDFSDWFTQLMIKAELADYSSVSGAIVFRPQAYYIWEKIKEETDARFKKVGIENAYFPLFIPEKTFDKLAKHTTGFKPEVAWVTETGSTKLTEKLAVRPTSETIMYESYSKWIRSWRDLPLKLNQWNNVVRWEFKHPVPFLRTREFLWNEGHTAYATKEEAEKESEEIISIYKEICEEYLALPSLIGRKSEKEKFAGADYTISMEFFLPSGKAIQGPDFHHDSQHFSKAYDIKFLDKDGIEKFVYQNTFAITTRMLGVMFATHSDGKGLVLPPKIAKNKVVVVPIFFEDSKEEVIKSCKKIESILKKFEVFVDDRDSYKPGFKFNEWELKGIPLRIEVGPKEIKEDSVIVFRRDTQKKESVKIEDLKRYVEINLEEIQNNLFNKAKKNLDSAIIEVNSLNNLKKAINDKKIAFIPLKNSKKVEDQLKFVTGGAKVLNIPKKQKSLDCVRCVISGEDADYFAYVAKSY